MQQPEIFQIIGHCFQADPKNPTIFGRVLHYFCRWRGFDSSHDKFVNVKDIQEKNKKLLSEYWWLVPKGYQIPDMFRNGSVHSKGHNLLLQFQLPDDKIRVQILSQENDDPSSPVRHGDSLESVSGSLNLSGNGTGEFDADQWLNGQSILLTQSQLSNGQSIQSILLSQSQLSNDPLTPIRPGDNNGGSLDESSHSFVNEVNSLVASGVSPPARSDPPPAVPGMVPVINASPGPMFPHVLRRLTPTDILLQYDFERMEYQALVRWNLPPVFLDASAFNWSMQPEVPAVLVNAICNNLIPNITEKIDPVNMDFVTQIFVFFLNILMKFHDVKASNYINIFSYSVLGRAMEYSNRNAPVKVIKRALNLLRGDFSEVVRRFDNDRSKLVMADDTNGGRENNGEIFRKPDNRGVEIRMAEKALKHGDMRSAMKFVFRDGVLQKQLNPEIKAAIEKKFPLVSSQDDRVSSIGEIQQLLDQARDGVIDNLVVTDEDLLAAISVEQGFKVQAGPGNDGMSFVVLKALITRNSSVASAIVNLAQMLMDGKIDGSLSFFSCTRGFANLDPESGKYRIGGVTPVLSRLLGRILLKCITRSMLNKDVDLFPFDFSTKRFGALRLVNKMMQKIEEEREDISLLFLDIQNMFQQFSRGALIRMMIEHKEVFGPLLPLAITTLYNSVDVVFHFHADSANFIDETFLNVPCERGFIIGHGLAGFFAIMGLSFAMAEASNQLIGILNQDLPQGEPLINQDDMCLKMNSYVDDLCVVLKDPNTAPLWIGHISAHLNKYGFCLAESKTSMLVGNREKDVNVNGCIHNDNIFQYSDANEAVVRVLGIPFGQSIGVTNYLNKTIEKCEADMRRISLLSSRGLSLQHTLAIFQNYVNSRLTYIMQAVPYASCEVIGLRFDNLTVQYFERILGITEIDPMQRRQLFLRWSEGGFGFIEKARHNIAVRIASLFLSNDNPNNIFKIELSVLSNRFNIGVCSSDKIELGNIVEVKRLAEQKNETLSHLLWDRMCKRSMTDLYNDVNRSADRILLLSNSCAGVMQAVVHAPNDSIGLPINMARVSIMLHMIGEDKFSQFIDPHLAAGGSCFAPVGERCARTGRQGGECRSMVHSNMFHVLHCNFGKYTRHQYLLKSLIFLARKIGIQMSGLTQLREHNNNIIDNANDQKRRVDVVFTDLSLLPRFIDVTFRSPFRDASVIIPAHTMSKKKIMLPLEQAEEQKKLKYQNAALQRGVIFDVFAVTHLGVFGKGAVKLMHDMANRYCQPNALYNPNTFFNQFRHYMLSCVHAAAAGDILSTLEIIHSRKAFQNNV